MKRRTVIKLHGSDKITITQRRLSSGLGLTDEASCKIDIEELQPEVGKHVVLMHELLHLIDAQMVREGITKRRASHDWIRNASLNLLALLVEAGVYQGVSKRELRTFLREMVG